MTPGRYDAGCVADDGSDGNYIKGNGPVLVIAGTGGKGMYPVDTSDSESGYFAAWMGGNVNTTWGFLKAAVTADSLSAQYVGATGGSFTDAFTISGSGSGQPSVTPPNSSSCNLKAQGDADCNGTIDFVDYDYYRRIVLLDSSVSPGISADFNGDGETGILDGTILVQSLGLR